MHSQLPSWKTAAKLVRAALCAGLVSAAAGAKAEEPRELVFLNWGQYMDPALVAEFEASHNARVKMIYFDAEEARDQLLLETDAKGYDVTVVAGRLLATYRARGWLAPLDDDNAPNLKYIDQRWRTLFPAADGYAAPYFWGTLGIAYRADLVPSELTSWKQLFEPGEALKGKIALSGDPVDTVGMALKALGHSANSADPKALAEVEAMLVKLKPDIRANTYVVSEDAAIVSGEVVAGMMYNGDALVIAEHNTNIRYVVPKEGSNLWVDHLAVLNGSANKDLARSFINFMNEPENATQLAEYLHYATPNAAARKLLPADVLADTRIYPTDDVLAKSEVSEPLPPRVEKRRSAIYAKVAY